MPSTRMLFLLLPVAASAQVLCSLGPAAASYRPSEDQRPSQDALELANRVNAAVSRICGNQCPTMALYRNATAPNAMLIADSSQAKLVYSPQFFATAYDAFGDGGILALLAHEIGHALDATLGAAWIKSTWAPELRADAWAGCVLARASVPLEKTLGALEKYPSASHPAWTTRLPVLRTGYGQCSK